MPVPETDAAEVEEKSTDTELEELEESFNEPEDDSEEEAEDEDDTEGESEETDDETEDESKGDESKESEETKESDEDKQKQHNREMAEKRIQEKTKRDAELKKQQQEYIAEADKDDPRDLAVRQLQVDAYNNKVEGNTNKLSNGFERALKDFTILSDPTPEIQAELNAALDTFQAMHVTMDEHDNPVEVRGDLYKFLQTKADSIARLTAIGARNQITSKDKEKSKTITPPSRAPKTPKEDPLLDGFDEEAKRY